MCNLIEQIGTKLDKMNKNSQTITTKVNKIEKNSETIARKVDDYKKQFDERLNKLEKRFNTMQNKAVDSPIEAEEPLKRSLNKGQCQLSQNNKIKSLNNNIVIKIIKILKMKIYK
eukprot:14482_1